MCFSYFWKDKSSLILNLFFDLFFTYFKLYIWISEPNSSMEGYEGGIFSKAPSWKPLFLLRIKFKENAASPNKEYNAIFKHIHQNIRAYLRCKEKSALVNNWEKILFYTIQNPCKVTRCRTSSVLSRYSLEIWEGSTTQEKNLSSFKFGNSIPSTYIDTKMLYKYEHFFFLKICNLIMYWVPLSLSYRLQTSCVWKTILAISQLFSELGNIWKYNIGLYLKTQFSIFFVNWGILISPAKATFKNLKISLWIGRNLKVQPKINTQKSKFWIYGWIENIYVLI